MSFPRPAGVTSVNVGGSGGIGAGARTGSSASSISPTSASSSPYSTSSSSSAGDAGVNGPSEPLTIGSTGGIPWARLKDKFFRKVDLFNMTWASSVTTAPFAASLASPGEQAPPAVHFDSFFTAGAQYGGPIAMLRDDLKVQRTQNNITEATRKMRILSSSGKLIWQFPWQHKGLVSLGWSDAWAGKEALVAVFENGNVMCFDIYGNVLSEFSLGEACRVDGVAECVIWPKGLAVRTGGRSQLVVVTNIAKGAASVTKLPDPMLKVPPACMAVLPPLPTSTDPLNELTVLLATQKGGVMVVTSRACVERDLDAGPFIKLAVSPAGDTVACFSENGTMHVMSSDLTQQHYTFSTMSRVPPTDLTWCGGDSIVLYWDQQPKRLLLMVGQGGDFVSFTYPCQLMLVPENDGLRVLSETKCEFLQRVPDATQLVFRQDVGSAGKCLFEAKDLYDARDVRADDLMRQLLQADELVEAIDTCLEAAAHELHLPTQKALLQAASFGKLYVTEPEGYDVDKFVDMCRNMRVVNAARSREVGIPLTYAQFENMEVDLLIERLKSHHDYLLALRICQYLRISPGHVLVDWACAKIEAAQEMKDAQLGPLIVSKFAICPGLSFAKVALAAHKALRQQLAVYLLDHEPKVQDQVRLLMEIRQEDLALTKAIASGDSDLVYQVLFHLLDTRPFKQFCTTIQDKPLARNLFISWCKQTDLEQLKEFYYHCQQPVESGNTLVMQAYLKTGWTDRMSLLNSALDAYNRDKANNPFNVQALEEQIELLKQERKWEDEIRDSSFVDLSVSQLIENYVMHSQLLYASKIKQAFKVPEKRYWHVEVRTLAKRGVWQELANRIANKKVPPIGYEPFIEACVENKAPQEAVRYIQQLSDPHEQMEWLVNISMWREAADIAFKEKDADALSLIRARCRNPALVAGIDKMLAQLGAR